MPLRSYFIFSRCIFFSLFFITRSALMQFSVLFSVDTSINRKKYYINFLKFGTPCKNVKHLKAPIQWEWKLYMLLIKLQMLWHKYIHLEWFCFCSGCQTGGVYGNSCKERCPANCRDNVCYIQKGTCYECDPGWIDTTCNTSMITLSFNRTAFLICFFYFFSLSYW